MGFRYRQAIGELSFAAVTCRPDVLFPETLLSQHNTSPAECFCTEVKRVHRCLRSTIDDGMHFWKPTADPKLPTTQLSTLHKDTHNLSMPDSSKFEPMSFAGACWAANLRTKRSVSRTSMFLEGTPINYKCKLQKTVH